MQTSVLTGPADLERAASDEPMLPHDSWGCGNPGEVSDPTWLGAQWSWEASWRGQPLSCGLKDDRCLADGGGEGGGYSSPAAAGAKAQAHGSLRGELVGGTQLATGCAGGASSWRGEEGLGRGGAAAGPQRRKGERHCGVPLDRQGWAGEGDPSPLTQLLLNTLGPLGSRDIRPECWGGAGSELCWGKALGFSSVEAREEQLGPPHSRVV